MLLARNRLRLWIYGVACGLALLSNYLFTGEWFTRFQDTAVGEWGPANIKAVVVLICAILAAGFAFNRRDNFTGSTWKATVQKNRWIADWLRILPCLLLYLAATILFWVKGESPLVRWLWLISIFALIITHLRSCDLQVFKSLKFWEYLLVVSITLVAFALRYVDLRSLPLQVHNDVSIMGLYSRTMLEEQNLSWIGMAITNHQYSEHQYLCWSMRLFGRDHYGLVMLSVLAGTATVPVIYFMGKIAFNRWVGILAACFLSMDYVHIHFSRIVFGPIATFFVALSCLFLIHGIKRANKLSFILSGISLGAGMLDYYSGRVGPVIVGCILIFWFFNRRKFPQIGFASCALVVLGAVAAFGPNLAYGIKESRTFHGRGNDVLLWTPGAWQHSSGKYGSNGNALIVLKEQTKRTFLSPFLFGDESEIFDLHRPMLGGMAVIFFTLGLGFCFRRFGDVSCLLPLLWIGMTFICGGVLTIDPPFWPHLNIAAPAMAVIAGIGAERILRRLILELGSRMRLILPPLLGIALVFSGLNNWEIYSRFVQSHSYATVLATRLIGSMPPETKIYLISNSIKWEHDSFQFFVPRMDVSNLSEADAVANPPLIDRPTAFFVFHDLEESTLNSLVQRYPGAHRRAYDDGWGGYTLTLIQVFPDGYVLPSRHDIAAATFPLEYRGWQLVFGGVGFSILFGWVLFLRETKRNRKKGNQLT